MKLKIKQRFTDKLTREIFTIGGTIERPEARAKQIIAAGVAEEVREEKKNFSEEVQKELSKDEVKPEKKARKKKSKK